MKTRLLLGLAAMLAVSAQTLAAPLVWTLNNVTTADGQSFTGSFTYDRDSQLFSSISIQNSGTVANPAATWDTLFFFNAASSPSNASNFLAMSLTNGPLNLTNRVIGLNWNQLGQQLTNAGGSLLLLPNTGGIGATCRDLAFNVLANCSDAPSFGGSTFRITGGSISAVPVPAAVWLFGSALGLIGVLRRKISS